MRSPDMQQQMKTALAMEGLEDLQITAPAGVEEALVDDEPAVPLLDRSGGSDDDGSDDDGSDDDGSDDDGSNDGGSDDDDDTDGTD